MAIQFTNQDKPIVVGGDGGAPICSYGVPTTTRHAR